MSRRSMDLIKADVHALFGGIPEKVRVLIEEAYWNGKYDENERGTSDRVALRDIAGHLGLETNFRDDWSEVVARAQSVFRELEETERARNALWLQNNEYGIRISNQGRTIQSLEARLEVAEENALTAYNRARAGLIDMLRDADGDQDYADHLGEDDYDPDDYYIEDWTEED